MKRSPLRRSGPIRKRNPERAAKRRAEQFGAQSKRCEAMECCVPGCGAGPPRVVAHHEPTRGAGGKDKNTVPLCVPHHDERHRVGVKTFEARYGVNLRELAHALSEGV